MRWLFSFLCVETEESRSTVALFPSARLQICVAAQRSDHS
jgi:hypothetical protein